MWYQRNELTVIPLYFKQIKANIHMLRHKYWLLCQYNMAKYYLGHLGVSDLDIKILYSEYKTAPIKTALKIQYYIYVKVATQNSCVCHGSEQCLIYNINFYRGLSLVLGYRIRKDKWVMPVKVSLTWKWKGVTKCSIAGGLLMISRDATHARQ